MTHSTLLANVGISDRTLINLGVFIPVRRAFFFVPDSQLYSEDQKRILAGHELSTLTSFEGQDWWMDEDLLTSGVSWSQHYNYSNHLAHTVPHVILHGVEHKSCSRCGSLLPLDCFYLNHRCSDGLDTACKPCQRLIQRLRYHNRKSQ